MSPHQLKMGGLKRLKTEIEKGVDSPKVDGDTAMKGLKGRIARRNDDLPMHEKAQLSAL